MGQRGNPAYSCLLYFPGHPDVTSSFLQFQFFGEALSITFLSISRPHWSLYLTHL